MHAWGYLSDTILGRDIACERPHIEMKGKTLAAPSSLFTLQTAQIK